MRNLPCLYVLQISPEGGFTTERGLLAMNYVLQYIYVIFPLSPQLSHRELWIKSRVKVVWIKSN